MLLYSIMYAWVWLCTKWRRLRGKVADRHRAFPMYLRKIRLNKDFPRLDSAPAYESEYPYREGTAVVVRVVGTRGLTLGIMNNHVPMDDKSINARLIAALRSADGTEAYYDQPDLRDAAAARSEALETDPDAQWLRSIGILHEGEDVGE
jgi:hypothetical protein